MISSSSAVDQGHLAAGCESEVLSCTTDFLVAAQIGCRLFALITRMLAIRLMHDIDMRHQMTFLHKLTYMLRYQLVRNE